MTKHTPGPWFASFTRHGKYFEVQTEPGMACGQPIAKRVTSQADANLLAAAPDLLAALEIAEEILRFNGFDDHALTARHAIAKARGEG